MDRKRAIIWVAVSTQVQADQDKESLPQQEEQARLLCEERGWQIVDILRVPGHSRNYFDFNKLKQVALASKLKIDAFHKIEQHWEKSDFDVLIVRDGDRFARTQSLHAYFTERTVLEAKAIIWSFADGEINEANCSGWTALSGYKASSENREKVKKYQVGMDGNAKRGLPVTNQPPFTHKLIRDQKTGRAKALVLDESKRPLFDALAEVLLEGISYKNMEHELYERGFTNKNGRRFHRAWAYCLLNNPATWGNMARHHRTGRRYKALFGAWVWDPSVTPPQGVKVYYDVIQPVYHGELAQSIQAELFRRSEIIKGRASSNNTLMFTGIVVCDECGYAMTYYSTKKYSYRGLRCDNAYRSRPYKPCNCKGYVSEKTIKDEIDLLLRELVEAGSFDPQVKSMIHEGFLPKKNFEESRENLKQRIRETESRARIVVRQQISAPEGLQYIYQEELEKLNSELQRDQVKLANLEQSHFANRRKQEQQQIAVNELIEMRVEGLWKKNPVEINQFLHRLMGDRRFVVRDHRIIGIQDRLFHGRKVV